MAIGVRYTATTALSWAEAVTCPHCGLKSRAGIAVVGVGTERASLGMGRAEAREQAGIGAFADAVGSAKSMILRARCPKCGKRAGGVAWLITKTFLLCGITAGVVIHWAGADRYFGRIFLATLLLVPAIVWQRLRAADARVRFEPLLELDEQPKERFVPAHLRLDPPEAPPPASPVASSQQRPSADADGELALDLDRSWHKKEG